jgi:hypothetical protein
LEVSVRTLFAPDARADIVARLRQFTPDRPRQWGQLTAPKALAHLGDQLRMAFGDIAPRPPRGPIRFWPMNYLLIHLLPWPKGRAKGPAEAFQSPPQAWADDQAAVIRLVERFAAADQDASWPTHSLFGRMRGRDWGVLCYKHLDHHLRQFGC